MTPSRNQAATDRSRSLVELDASDAVDVARFGGKGAGLAALHRAGFQVPKARLAPVDAFSECFESPMVHAHLQRLADRVSEHGSSLEDALRTLQRAICSVPLPAALSTEMSSWLGEAEALAVRSSSIREDGVSRAGAGQYTSVLGVTTETDLVRAARTVLASQFSPHVAAYWDGNIGAANEMSIVLQTMLSPDASGVIFTCDPVSGRSDVLVLEACFGLGSSVVDGTGVAQRSSIARGTVEILTDDIRAPRLSTHYDSRRHELVTKNSYSQPQAVLSSDEIVRVARTACEIEALYDGPVDVEWSIADGELYILQARPVTTLSGVNT